jgi:hypothetical protein
MKYCSGLFLTCFFLIISFRANSQLDYFIIKDTLIHYGVKIVDGGSSVNSSFCQVKYGGKIEKLSPDSISEYGFLGGPVYVSHVLPGDSLNRKVFMQVMNEGPLKLLYTKHGDKNLYFIQKDNGEIVVIPPRANRDKSTCWNILSPYVSGCSKSPYWKSQSKKSLSFLKSVVQSYNHCKNYKLPQLHYGFSIGYEVTSLIVPSSINDPFLDSKAIEKDGSFTANFFMEIPIKLSNFLFHSEIQFTRNNFDYFNDLGVYQKQMVINISGLSVPLLIKYEPLGFKPAWRPYIEMGTGVFFPLKNEAIVLESQKIYGDLFPQSYYNDSPMSGFNAGISGGAGVDFRIFQHFNGYAGVRYQQSFPISGDTYFGKRDWFLTVSLFL